MGKVEDAKAAAKAKTQAVKAAAVAEVNKAQADKVAAEKEADEEVKAADAEAKTTAVKNAGEVDSLVKGVQDVAAKQVADKAAEGTSALTTAQESTRTVKSMAEDLSKKLALNIENFDVAITDLKSVAP